jgi:hypothetical protein
MSQNPSSNSTLHRFQNYGYEYLSSIYRMKEEHDQLSSKGITPYIMPVKVLSVACLAIEEYVNVAGFRIDPHWEEFDHETESIRDRLTYIFDLAGKPGNFEAGIWKDVLELFEMESLIKKDTLNLVKYHKKEIPEIIEKAANKFPIRFSQAVAEKAIELLLTYSSVSFPLERIMQSV